MPAYNFFILIIIAAIKLPSLIHAVCPKTIPHEIEDKCYRFQVERLRFDDAQDSCMKLVSGANIVTIKTETTLKKIEQIIYNYLTSNLEKALFWIGFQLDDTDATKPLGDRDWKWDFDKSKIVQKDYTLWDTDGGPNDKTFQCAAINASNFYLVKGVDCGAPVLPVICRMNKNKDCKDDKNPYLMYGNYCLASSNGAFEFNKIQGVCSPGKPTTYTDETKDYVINAAKNYFLGGGMFLYYKRNGPFFYDMTDGTLAPSELWEEGEPRDNDYNCAGLSIQSDDTLKLKALSCDFHATSLCGIDSSDACRSLYLG